LLLRGFIASADGRRMLSDEIRGAPGEDEAIGRRLADSLLARGAGALLAEIEA
jgi:hydroxymethylbilane synthase